MKLTKTLKKTLIAFCILGFAQFASPGVISFDPTPATGDVNDAIFVDLVWDGTTGPGGAYLGDWDVDIGYDDSIVTAVSVAWSFGVDSLGCIVGFSCGAFAGGGVLDIFEFSLDTVGGLIANQDGLGNSFVIATIEFLAIAEGETALALSGQAIGDEGGNAISPTLNDGLICVGPDGCVVAVPTPSSLPLVMLALLGLFGLRRKLAA